MKFELIFIGEYRPDLFSRLIQWGQRRLHGVPVNFSHVAILVDGSRVFDSTGRGFDECSLAEALDWGKAVIRDRIELPVTSPCCALAWLEGRKGIPYPRLQFLGLVFPELRHLPAVGNGFKKAFCSESGADFLFHWVKTAKRDYRLRCRDFITPYALRDIARDHRFIPPLTGRILKGNA